LQLHKYGFDSSFLQANAAMKAIVRRDSGADWKAYLRQLAAEDGRGNPSDEDLRRLDRQRPETRKRLAAEVRASGSSVAEPRAQNGETLCFSKALHALRSTEAVESPTFIREEPEGVDPRQAGSLVRARINSFAPAHAAASTQARATRTRVSQGPTDTGNRRLQSVGAGIRS